MWGIEDHLGGREMLLGEEGIVREERIDCSGMYSIVALRVTIHILHWGKKAILPSLQFERWIDSKCALNF